MSGRPRTLTEVPDSLAPLLAKARRRPVALSRNGKATAFLVSARYYDNMQEIMQRALCCDKIVNMYAERLEHEANKDGTLGKKASLKLMSDIAEVVNAEEDRWCCKMIEEAEKNGGLETLSVEESRKLTENVKKAAAEDRYWTKVADKAMKEGVLSIKESEEFLTNMRKRLDSTH